MLKISFLASKQFLIVYLIGDLTANSIKIYNEEVVTLIKKLQVRNLIINANYLNNIDEIGIKELIKTYQAIKNH